MNTYSIYLIPLHYGKGEQQSTCLLTPGFDASNPHIGSSPLSRDVKLDYELWTFLLVTSHYIIMIIMHLITLLNHFILHCSYSSMKSTMAYSMHLSHRLSFRTPQLVELELGREDSQSDGDLGPKSLEAKVAKSSPWECVIFGDENHSSSQNLLDMVQAAQSL